MARVVVVGGGFGGLASALRLAKLGHEVTLVEERELGGALAPVTRTASRGTPRRTRSVPGVVRDLFRKTRPSAGEGARAGAARLPPRALVRGRVVAGAAGGSRRAARRRSTRSAPGLGTHGSTTWRRTPTTGRCCAAATSRCPGPPATCRARWPRGSTRRETLHKRLEGALRDPRLRLVAGHPFAVDGHDDAQRARLGRPDGIPRAARSGPGRSQTAPAPSVTHSSAASRRARVTVVPAARADDVVVRDRRAVAVATSAGELDADVVVCAVDPRLLPRWRR